MPEDGMTIRQMTAEDLPIVEALRRAENWNQTPKDLERCLVYEPEGCFVACCDGTPVGTVTTTAYGRALGWIGMMLVHSDYRRRGIASALIERSLEYLRGRNVASIKLDATSAGEPVYARLGFQAEWEFERWERPGPAAPVIEIPIQKLFESPDFDAAIFGANRSAWLERLAKESRVIQRESAFGMLRAGSRAAYLGPVIADDLQSAREIIQKLVGSIESHIFWDVPTPNASAVLLAKEMGFRPVRKLLRMWTGEPNKGDVSRQYAIADPATG
jgi:predicted N-acetyltransferase YhbS